MAKGGSSSGAANPQAWWNGVAPPVMGMAPQGTAAPVMGQGGGAPPSIMPTNNMMPTAQPGLASPVTAPGQVGPSPTAAPSPGATPLPTGGPVGVQPSIQGLLSPTAPPSGVPAQLHPALQGLLNAAGWRGGMYG